MIKCPRCGRENPEGFRFCGSCAAPLADEAPAPREERKVVTVLFCDLVGSTAQAERLDPEDVRALLSRYHERVRTDLERFGGTVEKFIGDASWLCSGRRARTRMILSGRCALRWRSESGPRRTSCKCGSVSLPVRRSSRSPPTRGPARG
jgi:class 3 adenylate cyclase